MPLDEAGQGGTATGRMVVEPQVLMLSSEGQAVGADLGEAAGQKLHSVEREPGHRNSEPLGPGTVAPRVVG